MKSLKIGGYVRVSTDEQKKYGYSVQAQIDRIKKWCDDNGYTLIDIFNDEGYTAGNMKRPALRDMLNRLDEFDVIAFTRLDRFSRNVLDANKILETLRKHGINLISIEEDDIDTTTADGMFIFQLKVSLAERELKKTSERIKSVFDYKIQQRQPVTGKIPYGYKIVTIDGKKRVVKDENIEPIVNDMFEHFATYHSARATMTFINEKYNLSRAYITYIENIKNPLYCGKNRDVNDFCPAYITPEQFERNQITLKNNVRQRKTHNVYLFSGLLKCPICGRKLVGVTIPNSGKIYHRYRCNGYTARACSLSTSINETRIEKFIVAHVNELAEQYVLTVTDVKPVTQNTDKRLKELKAEMNNLNYMFQKQRISAAEYDREYEALEAALKNIQEEEKPRDVTAIKDFLNSDWQSIYNKLDRTHKQALWQNLIEEIKIDSDFNISLVFR